MFHILVLASVFVCVACLVGGVAILARVRAGNAQMENRLANLTKNRGRGQSEVEQASILASPLEAVANPLEEFFTKTLNLSRYLDQAGIKVPAVQFAAGTVIFAVVATVVYVFMVPMIIFAPFILLTALALPIMYIWWKRKKRLRVFSGQLADAMDMMSRALRSGYSLPAGIQLVAEQTNEPLGPEFMRCFEQQNLGVSLEDSIRDMTERVPNLDLQFFCTAVILQRQTGGDLAEILDKISSLIRERFKIWGQIQALTGEGRLSGIVLLALPPLLFLVMLKLNYDYVMLLFNDPLGNLMLVGGIIMQIIGAIVIKKIITIKV